MPRSLPSADLDEILLHAGPAFDRLRHARLFLTGGTGFFGHWLLESLLHANRALALGLRVTVLTRDATRFATRSPHLAHAPELTLLEADIATFPFPTEPHTHILHAATDSTGAQAGTPPYALAESILEGARRTLRFALATGASRYLLVSTGAVYGRSTPLSETPETYTGAPDPLLLSSAYEESKRMAEHLAIAYTHATPLAAVIARPFAFVGPHLPLDAHFAIGNFLQAALHHRPIHITGDGTPRRSWLYMSDLATWLWTLLTHGEPARAYNVGSDQAYALADAARLTASTLSPGLPIHIAKAPDPTAPLNSYVPAIGRARTELGLRITVPLAEALRRTAAWHRTFP